jgi:hypothetical protein
LSVEGDQLRARLVRANPRCPLTRRPLSGAGAVGASVSLSNCCGGGGVVVVAVVVVVGVGVVVGVVGVVVVVVVGAVVVAGGGVTVMVTVAGLESSRPSVAR